jgi:ABC-type nickel/cobalt efflux system permease component RcnA
MFLRKPYNWLAVHRFAVWNSTLMSIMAGLMSVILFGVFPALFLFGEKISAQEYMAVAAGGAVCALASWGFWRRARHYRALVKVEQAGPSKYSMDDFN